MSIKLVKAQKKTQTFVDTIEINKDLVSKWRSPPFQRPLRVNDKVRILAEKISCDGGVIPGVLTIGIMNGQRYLLDGQHRIHAFLMSGVATGYADVRSAVFDSVGEMGEEFVTLNSSLVRFRPDDILRGLEESNDCLKLIRRKCPFVGYDNIRRGTSSPVVSMSQILRCWVMSSQDSPAGTSGCSAAYLASNIIENDAEVLANILTLFFRAWGRDQEYQRLWTGLNMTLCMWLYRRMVITQYSAKSTKLNDEQFVKCCMSLSADSTYLQWLVGRQLRESDRRPCYDKIKSIFSSRIKQDNPNIKPLLPAPAWSVSR